MHKANDAALFPACFRQQLKFLWPWTRNLGVKQLQWGECWLWQWLEGLLSPDLPTHPLFSGDTRILQGSPAHPRRIASHPHLARLCERCAKRRSFPLIQSATGSWRRGNTVQRKLWREKTWRIDEKYDFRGESSRGLLAFVAPRMPHPQILRGKNFAKGHKTQTCKS